jgi:predicted RNA-binding protein with PIN domain
MELLIDGYNLLHQSPSMTVDRGPGWTQRARTRLIHWLAHYLPTPVQAQTLVVFDPPKRPSRLDLEPDGSQLGNHRTDGSAIEVRFAIGYPEADQLLIELIGKQSHPTKLLVVSSDRAIRTAAQRRRSEHQASQQWIDDLLARSPQALPPRFRQVPSNRWALPASETGKRPPADSNFNWIAWFGLENHQTSTQSQELPIPATDRTFPRKSSKVPTQETTNASADCKEPPAEEPPAKKGSRAKEELPAEESANSTTPRKRRLPGKPPQLPPDWNPNEFLDS